MRGALHHLAGQAHGQGRQGQGLVLDHLPGHAAVAEGEHRTEDRVHLGGHEQLVRAGPAPHFLDREPFDVGVGPLPGAAGQDRGRAFPDALRGLQVQEHAAHVERLGNLRAAELQGPRGSRACPPR